MKELSFDDIKTFFYLTIFSCLKVEIRILKNLRIEKAPHIEKKRTLKITQDELKEENIR